LTADESLAIVGLSPAQLADITGLRPEDGAAYLVGSLSVKFGNAGSDVDVHVFQPGLAKPAAPKMFFSGDVVIDVERIPVHYLTDLVALCGERVVATTRWGRVALGPAPPPGTTQRRLGRWTHAVPLWNSPALLAGSDLDAVTSLLVRGAFERMLVAISVARLASEAGAAAGAQLYLWSRAHRRMVDLLCRVRGEVISGEKWLLRRARRAGVPDPAQVADERSFRVLAREAGLPSVDEWRLTEVRVAAGVDRAAIGNQRFLVTRHGRMLTEWCTATGLLADVVEAAGGARVLAALRRAELDLVPATPRIDGVLSSDG
jgi:hypothetical protein